MTYNIRNGGQPDRLDAILRVVTGQRPDILALQELRRFDAATVHRVEAATGMAAFVARSRSGQPVAVLARPQVVTAKRIPGPFHHAAASVTVDTDHGPLTVVSTHLNPYSGWRRLWEARWLARRVRPERLMLLMGDLNTLDPWTDHSGQLRDLAPEFRARHLWRKGVDTRAVAVLARAGLVDLFEPDGVHDYTAPTRYGGGTEFSRMRLDYILGTPGIADLTRTCRIISGGESESASDHYPVVAELDLTLTAAG